ncbi:SH3 domain-containing protein [Hyphomonas sp.]|jgi:SH3-like domain-containing protein|uniref:SH3 domain-containing protein n=1 Tax=Hyphomonas sp. TaxID=87 RepID=UPI0025C51EB7|nr:SH3 domain-containing protein [Hyphomonas sp.]
MKRAVLALAVLLAGPSLPFASAEGQEEVQISRFSGKPVPRFETLRHEKVNGRVGPSKDHKVQWEYKRRGLPMLILKESGDWRYVRDPQGDEVWIERTQLAAQQNAVALADFVLKAGRASDSADVATVSEGALLELGTCDASMCQVTAGGFRGWAPRRQLWGATATKG